MNRRPPALAFALGFAGLLPFFGCGLAALSLPGEQALHLLSALLAYGAVILSFLGGVHWGLALADETGRAERPRYALGVLPSLIGWLALLVMLLPWGGGPELGLAVLILGYAATVAVEAQGARQGLVPPRYMALRWGLTAIVVLLLTLVLVLRLAGTHINL